ncbi:MAG: hypothetical protein HYU66_13925 [Armatimonadetes bacterium]|nr:hypothetical protein [Armatimonadota bacterium]
MRAGRGWLAALLLPALARADDAGVARALAAHYHRATSRVMVRVVPCLTRAELDEAAYEANIMLQTLAPPATPPAPPTVALGALTFGGALVRGSIVVRRGQTPLTAAELGCPLALEPLLDYLARWDYDRAEKLLLAAAEVAGEQWGRSDRAQPVQQLVTGWLHDAPDGPQLWARIEFVPGVGFVAGLADEDGDGCPEAYGRVRADALDPALVARIRDDYAGRVLSPGEARKYFNELVARWYPRLRTYLLKPEETRPWPSRETEAEVVAELGGRHITAPLAVIKGKPAEQTLYNVFVSATAEPEARAGLRFAADEAPAPDPPAGNMARWQAELAECGGSWAAWAERLAPFRADVAAQLAARPSALKGLVGRDGFLFFRGDLDYLVAGELRGQPDGRDPFPAIVDFQKQLAGRGIDLLLVLIPGKPEVFPEKLSAKAPDPALPAVQPFERKLLLELAEAGVEAVDLLPAFLRAKAASPEPFYMTQDTHWSNTAARVAARLVAERVRQYPWFTKACPRPIAYRTRTAEFTRRGDIVEMLTPAEAVRCRPMKLTAEQVLLPDGTPYADDPASPVVVLGDSYCGVFHQEDCEHAGFARGSAASSRGAAPRRSGASGS